MEAYPSVSSNQSRDEQTNGIDGIAGQHHLNKPLSASQLKPGLSYWFQPHPSNIAHLLCHQPHKNVLAVRDAAVHAFTSLIFHFVYAPITIGYHQNFPLHP